MNATAPQSLAGRIPCTNPGNSHERPHTARTAAKPGALALFVPGNPAPQGSKSPKGRTKTGRVILVESSKRVKPWRETIRLHAIAKAGVNPVDSGPVSARVEFVMPSPQSTPKRVTLPAVKRPDLDKLLRAVFDALTGVAFRDDSQVVSVSASKRLAEPGETPGVAIRVDAL